MFHVHRRLAGLAAIVAVGTLGLSASTAGADDSSSDCTSAPRGLVSWWPGDGNASDIADSNDGTLQEGASFAAGKVDQAFSLDGIDDYVLVPHNANLAFGANQNFTIDAWVNLQTPIPEHDDGIVQKWDVQNFRVGVTQSFYGLELVRDTHQVGVRLWSAGAGFVLLSNSAVPLGVWTHVAFVRDGNVGRIYIDGALDKAAPVPTGTLANSDPLAIGGFYDTQFNPPIQPRHTFGGLLDEIEIADRALSADRIEAIFEAGSAGKCKADDGDEDEEDDDADDGDGDDEDDEDDD